LISFSVTRLLINECYYAPFAQVVKSFPLNMIKNLQESLLTEILPHLTSNTAYRPYIECPPSRGDTARCSPRYLFGFVERCNGLLAIFNDTFL